MSACVYGDSLPFFGDTVSYWPGACQVNPNDLLVSTSLLSARIQVYTIMTAFLCIFWGSNSHSHACATNTLVTELSAQLWKYLTMEIRMLVLF